MSDSDSKKKERVIHTRVSENLDRELRERASKLGVSVSKLVRNALQNTFGLVENIVADSARVADAASNLARPRTPPPAAAPVPTTAAAATNATPTTLGWQPLVLNLNAICAHCNDILPRGTQAALAITDIPAPRHTFICTPCLDTLNSATATPQDTPDDPSDA